MIFMPENVNEPKSSGKGLDKELNDFFVDNTTDKGAQQKTVVSAKKVVKMPARQTRKKGIIRAPILTKGKRKEAVARASMTSGTGRIFVNGIRAEMLKPRELSELILEPVKLSKTARGIISGADVKIEVYGGGVSGQAQACRNALAKVIVAASNNEELKKVYMSYDRNILVDDHRRIEPKKFLGTKARARFQTSYR